MPLDAVQKIDQCLLGDHRLFLERHVAIWRHVTLAVIRRAATSLGQYLQRGDSSRLHIRDLP